MEKKSLYAASKNKDPIFQVLNPRLKLLLADNAKVIEKYELTPEGSGDASLTSPADRASLSVLEVAAGTGEHAAYVGENSDIIENDVHYIIMEPDATMHESILAWSKDAEEKKINFKYSAPIGLSLSMEGPSPDFSKGPIAVIAGKNIGSVDVIICINMIHISHISSTEALFRLGRAAIRKGGLLYLYGPYRVNGTMVPSNEQFDLSLKQRNPDYGIRDLEYVQEIGRQYGFELEEKIEMPSNNLSVIFRHSS